MKIINNNPLIYCSKMINGILGFLLVTLAFLVPQIGHTTHIIGGDLTYKCLGNTTYEITLTYRRDCDTGQEPFDAIAKVGIFDHFGNQIYWMGTGGFLNMTNPTIDTIDTALDSGCEILGNPVCVEEAVYTKTIDLPFRNYGYTLAYQRCCRNESLINIVDPLLAGATYYTVITEEALNTCNDSPKFKNWADIYICANSTFTFDHSATDADGDSLVYKLCSPKKGASFDDPNPSQPDGPPFENVVFKPPFSADNPLGGTPLEVDPHTGILTGNPNAVGQFLVGICVEEYRDGELISKTTRDFQYNVRVCTAGPEAAFEAPELTCDGLTVEFTNLSTDADSYTWNFNVGSTDSIFMSNEENPTFTYPEQGIYEVSLEAYRDLDGCSTTIYKTIGVYDSEILADFEFSLENCNADSSIYNFTDLSVDPDFDITSRNWEFTEANGFQKTSSDQNPRVHLPKSDNVIVTLTVYSESGCSATIEKTVDADPLDLEVISNPSMICEGDSIAILLEANCDVLYSIIPLENTYKNPEDCNIYVFPTTTTKYRIFASNGICFDSTSLTIEVIEKSELEITGNTTICDGEINASVTGDITGNQIDWSLDSEFNNIIGDGSNSIIVPFPSDQDTVILYAKVKEGTGCSDIVSEIFYNRESEFSYDDKIILCEGENEEIFIMHEGGEPFTVEWTDNDIIVNNFGDTIIVLSSDLDLNTTLSFQITNEFGCIYTGEIQVTVDQKPEANYTFDYNCDDLGVCFTNSTDLDVFWDFGDLTTDADTSIENQPCYTFPEAGTYTVTMSINEGACQGLSVTKDIVIEDVIDFSIDVGAVVEACKYDSIEANIITDNTGLTYEWYINGELVNVEEIFNYSFDETTEVIVIATNSIGCTLEKSFIVEIYSFDIEVDVPNINCATDTVSVSASNTADGDFIYEWFPEENLISSNDNTAEIHSEFTTDMYVVTTNTENGCKDTTDFTFNVSEIDATLYATPENPYQCSEVEVGVEAPDSDWTYVWSTGDTDSYVLDSIMQNTTYTVTITDDNGCTAVESIDVTVQLPNCDETDVFIPSAFSPNNDGNNDVLYVRSNYIKKMELKIYDRWGELIFTSNDISNGWDGTFYDKELAPDVYAFSLMVTCSNGADYQKIGNITLIR